MQSKHRALVLCAAGLLGAIGALQAQDDSIYWFGDYREAVKEARKTNKPMLVEFRCEA